MKEYLEKNKDTLSGAIADLPTYPAPVEIWEKVESGLECREQFQTALSQLPQYSPPAMVWENIERSLDVPVVKSRPSRYRLLRVVRPGAAAAILCALALGVWWFLNAEIPASTSIVSSVEIRAQVDFSQDWKTEEEEMAMVVARVEQSPVADPRVVDRLKLEYEELTDARSEVEAMMQRYGQDEALLKEVARIERERSQVIKELATWI